MSGWHVFPYEGHQARFFEDAAGGLWILADDLCCIMGTPNVFVAIAMANEESAQALVQAFKRSLTDAAPFIVRVLADGRLESPLESRHYPRRN